MSNHRHPYDMVLDTNAWQGQPGFRGSDEYKTFVRNQDEGSRLNHLLGMALLDESIRHRLVDARDESLLASFGLSESTKKWIITMRANSLTDIASAVAANYQMSA
jgi:hypothetical protein